jgi:4a-hydroxytetrahydrobiopterin dehydratase
LAAWRLNSVANTIAQSNEFVFPKEKEAPMQKLTNKEREAALATIPDWRPVEGRDAISRSLNFKDFSAAWGFMSRVALAAQAMDHHPEWSNIFNRVDIVLSTHDAGGLTDRDIALARRIDAVAGTSGARTSGA